LRSLGKADGADVGGDLEAGDFGWDRGTRKVWPEWRWIREDDGCLSAIADAGVMVTAETGVVDTDVIASGEGG